MEAVQEQVSSITGQMEAREDRDEAAYKELATKGDILDVRRDIEECQKDIKGCQKDIKECQKDIKDCQKEIQEIRLEIKNVELRLLKWQIGIGAALFTSIFTALAKGFHWFGF